MPNLALIIIARECSKGCTFKEQEQNENLGTTLLIMFNLFPAQRSVVTLSGV